MGEECALVGIIDSPPTPLYFHKRTVKEKLQRFTKMIFENDWGFVTELLRRRLIIPITGRWAYLVADRQLKKKADFWINTNAILEEYVWEIFPGKITLFATEQRQENQSLKYLIDEWTLLAKGGVDAFILSGNHENIFKEPEVQKLAQQIKQCLDKTNK